MQPRSANGIDARDTFLERHARQVLDVGVVGVFQRADAEDSFDHCFEYDTPASRASRDESNADREPMSLGKSGFEPGHPPFSPNLHAMESPSRFPQRYRSLAA